MINSFAEDQTHALAGATAAVVRGFDSLNNKCIEGATASVTGRGRQPQLLSGGDSRSCSRGRQSQQQMYRGGDSLCNLTGATTEVTSNQTGATAVVTQRGRQPLLFEGSTVSTTRKMRRGQFIAGKFFLLYLKYCLCVYVLQSNRKMYFPIPFL